MMAMPASVARLLERLWAGWRVERGAHGNVGRPFLFEFPVQQHWGARVAFYLFLGGTGAALVLVEVLMRWAGLLGEGAAVAGMWIGIVLAMLSVLAIFDHLGPRVRWSFWFAFRRPRRSWISRGVLLVTALIILRLVVALPTLPGAAGLPWAEGSLLGDLLRGLIVGMALAFMLYTGLVIASWNAIASWNTPIVPVLFVASSLLGGLAAVPLSAWVTEGTEAVIDLGRTVMPWVVALAIGTGILIGLYLHGLRTGSRPARVAGRMLLGAPIRRRFIGGVLTLGLLVPVLLMLPLGMDVSLDPSIAAILIATTAILVQAGGYLLRDSILRSGVYGPPL